MHFSSCAPTQVFLLSYVQCTFLISTGGLKPRVFRVYKSIVVSCSLGYTERPTEVKRGGEIHVQCKVVGKVGDTAST